MDKNLPIPKLLKLLKLPPDFPPSHLPLFILDERETNPKELLKRLMETSEAETFIEVLTLLTKAETKNNIKKEPESKKKQHTTKLEAVKVPKTEARKVPKKASKVNLVNLKSGFQSMKEISRDLSLALAKIGQSVQVKRLMLPQHFTMIKVKMFRVWHKPQKVTEKKLIPTQITQTLRMLN